MATKPPRKGSSSSATGEPAGLAALARIVGSIAANGEGDTYFAESEVEQWPSTLRRALDRLSLVELASPATTVVCPGCEQACVMPVLIDPPYQGFPARGSVGCDVRDDIGIVDVPLAMLKRRKSNGQLLAKALATLLLPGGTPATLDAMRWRIGRLSGASQKSDLVLSLVTGAQLAVAGHTVELQEVLKLGGGALVLDLAHLRKLVDSPTGTKSKIDESGQDRADRIRRRIEELRSKGVRNFKAIVAAEEDVDTSRISQILRRFPETRQVASPIPTASGSPRPPHKKSYR